MTVVIRDMLIEDYGKIAMIHEQGIATNKATFQTEALTLAEWAHKYHTTGRLVAEKDGVVVGWCALLPTSTRPAYQGVMELSIYIDQNYKRQGIGRALLMELNELAEEAGIWTLQSLIMADNEASIALHKQCGYREVGYREKLGKDTQGNWRDIILMERRSKTIF